MRALIVEDQERLADLIEAGLRRAGFVADQAASLDDADAALDAAEFDLILLDLGLPDGDGMRWLKKARGRGLAAPVLIVTARGELEDKIGGLDTGADDYVTKPFAMDELLARCRALVRRPHETLNAILSAGDVALDTVARRVRVNSHDVEFGKREVDILEVLLRRPGRVVTREDLEQRIYGFGEEVTPNAIEVAVSRIRKKLAEAGPRLTIHTVRGIGYYLRAEYVPQSLGATITRRLLVVALAGFGLQLAYVTIDLAGRGHEIEEAVVERELTRIAARVVPAGVAARVDLSPDEARHYADFPEAYGYELSTSPGRIVDWRNPALFEGRPVELNAGALQGMQLDTIAGNERLVALRRIAAAGGNYIVRVAAIGDPAGLYAREFRKQILDRVMLPIVPLTAIMLVVLLLVVRQALRPIEKAARAVAAIDLPSQAVRLDLAGAPAEIVALGSAVNRLLDRLEQALSSHREFAANVAHELRTPLSLLTLELGKVEGPSGAQMREDVKAMARLVDQLLAIARIEGVRPEHLETLDLAAIARGVVMRFVPAAIAQGRELELAVTESVAVRGERETIAGAIRNLIENAVRAAPAGSAVEVRVGPGSAVAVIDNGPGIPAAELPLIFDRYRQGDRKTSGSAGLGLSIVSRTMERHGGTVMLTTAPDAGCVFTLRFPELKSAATCTS